MGCGVIQMYDLPVGECALGVMGCDWWGRGVYWQIIGKILVSVAVGYAVQEIASG